MERSSPSQILGPELSDARCLESKKIFQNKAKRISKPQNLIE